MEQPRHVSGALEEPRHDLLGVHPQLDDLQRDAPPHRLGLLCDVDHAAAAFANPFQQLVATQRLADRFVGNVGEIELDGGTSRIDLRGQQRVRLLMRREQRFEAGAQSGVVSAHGVQKGGTLGGGFCQRQRE